MIPDLGFGIGALELRLYARADERKPAETAGGEAQFASPYSPERRLSLHTPPKSGDEQIRMVGTTRDCPAVSRSLEIGFERSATAIPTRDRGARDELLSPSGVELCV